MSSESSMPQIQNIVSTINLDCKLDLKIIAMRAPNTEYNPLCCCDNADKKTSNNCTLI